MFSVSSIFILYTFKFYHIFIYTFTSMFCLFFLFITSVSSTNTSATVHLFKFWVSNFSIWFFLAVQVLFFFFFFPFKVFWFTECKFVLDLRTIFFKYKIHAGRILNFSRYLPKHPETPEIDRNDPKFFPKWNRMGYCFGLFTGTVFSSHYSWNGMKLITLNQI